MWTTRQPQLTYLSLVLANIGAVIFTQEQLELDTNAYTLLMLCIGVVCTLAGLAYLAGLRFRYAEEGPFLNAAWFIAVGVLIVDTRPEARGAWGLALVMLAAAVACWGMWLELKVERQQTREGVTSDERR